MVAHLRTQDRLERFLHHSSIKSGSDHFQVVIASTNVSHMNSYTRRKCPLHSTTMTSTECTCGIRQAAEAAVALRPIPIDAICTGGTVAVELALRIAHGSDTDN